MFEYLVIALLWVAGGLITNKTACIVAKEKPVGYITTGVVVLLYIVWPLIGLSLLFKEKSGDGN